MSSTKATAMADQETLQAILFMLHRIEASLEDWKNNAPIIITPSPRFSKSPIDRGRGSSIITTSSPASCACSCVGASTSVMAPPAVPGGGDPDHQYHHHNQRHYPSAPEEEQQQRRSALAYLATVAELRDRFEFDGNSDPGQNSNTNVSKRHQTLVVDGTDDDGRSESVYPSRPLSQLGLGLAPLPQVSEPQTQSKGEGNVEIPTVRYEDTLDSPGSTSDSAASTRQSSQSDSLHSSDTVGTSIHTWPSSIIGKEAPHLAFSKLIGSLKQSVSLSARGKKRLAEWGGAPSERSATGAIPEATIHDDKVPEDTISGTTEAKVRHPAFLRLAQKGAKACVAHLSNLVSGVGRAMVNQQLKMLDVAA